MVFLYHGRDAGLTLHVLKKDMAKKGEDYLSSTRYDAYRDPVGDVVSDCLSLSLFGDKKVVVLSNCYFLTQAIKSAKGPVKEAEQDYAGLLSLPGLSDASFDLYLLVPGLLSPSLELVKALKKAGVSIKECLAPKEEDFLALGYQRAKERNKTIDKAALSLLLSRTGGDYLLFCSYLDLLLTYTDAVRAEDVERLVYKPLEDKSYECVSHLLKGETGKALLSYRNVRAQGTEALLVLLSFVSQFRTMALVLSLNRQGEGNEEIARTLSKKGSPVKPGRIYYMLKDMAFLPMESLLSILTDLGDIEEKVKLEKDDPDVLLELFLLDFRKYRKAR